MCPDNEPTDTLPLAASFPAAQAKFPWLTPLLQAYHIADRGVAQAIAQRQARGRQLACAKGCSACCRSHSTIPVYPLELVGLTWYATEQVAEPLRATLRAQLAAHVGGGPCPFLVQGVCSVHPLRPLACRQFNVFGRACAEGEDAYYTRREDVLDPVTPAMDEAFYTMLPYYGIHGDAERRQFVATGAQHRFVQVLQTCRWPSLARKMGEFDAAHVEGDGLPPLPPRRA
jgi:Fe-S-cluster containining protein